MDAASGRAAHARQTPSHAMFACPSPGSSRSRSCCQVFLRQIKAADGRSDAERARQAPSFAMFWLMSVVFSCQYSRPLRQNQSRRVALAMFCTPKLGGSRSRCQFQFSAAKSEQASSPCYVLHAQARRFSFSFRSFVLLRMTCFYRR